jgi:pimeloyl-ACP methyl ester carboxylesterase
MQQQIGFCTTADGVRIAYATVSVGPALMVAPWAPSHLGLEWEEPRVRQFWEAVGRHHTVVRCDKHGSGLSDRKRADFSLDSEVQTIEAIVRKLELQSFVLWGHAAQGGAAAISYVAKFPDRVSHLILSNAQAKWHGVHAYGGMSQETHRELLLSNWRISQLSMVETMFGSGFDASALQWWLRVNQESVTPEMIDQLNSAQVYKVNLRDVLPQIRVPTLVVHYRNNRAVPFEAGCELAAEIPGARFVPLEGDAHIFYFSDTRPLRRAIAEFLGDPVEEVGPTVPDPVTTSALEAQGIFRKEGEFWTIACRSEVFRLKDVRGLGYIAYLPGHPGEEFHVLALASKTGGTQDDLAEPGAEEQAAQSGLSVGRMGDAGEMLDAQAKAAYKRRTAELCEQLEEARELNQLERVDQLEEEIEAVGRELSRAVGLGGRDRRAASASERARINVTRAIKVALERIAEHNPALATLLTSSVRTGTFCIYTPDSRLPTSWQLSTSVTEHHMETGVLLVWAAIFAVGCYEKRSDPGASHP